MDKVSIVIPIYRVENYIERCILSVLNQTYPNIEIILVDDASPDRSIDIAKNTVSVIGKKTTCNIQYLSHDYNRGLSASRNTGLLAATGKYVYFLDSDDALPPNSINDLYSTIEHYKGLQMTFGYVETFPNHINWYDISKYGLHDVYQSNDEIRQTFYRPNQKTSNHAWNKLFLREFLLSNHLFFKEGLIHEDDLWTYMYVKKLCSFAITRYVTYHHYIRSTSITRTISLKESALNKHIVITEILNHLDSYCKQELKKVFITIFLPEYNLFYHLPEYIKLRKEFLRISNDNRMYFFSLRIRILPFFVRLKTLIRSLIYYWR
jgi:glycosyltransferase involved in cell wall biosynthesis